jgi:riboflavin kinase/FMN adenylyltransferase
LTTRSEKVQQLSLLGVEQLVLLPFDRELASLSPQEFVEKILIQRLQATHVSVGEDFHFGHRRAGTAYELQAIASSYGVEVSIVSLQMCQGERISSSSIRQSLQEGDISKANLRLGRPLHPDRRCRQRATIGQKARISYRESSTSSEKFLPKHGVYGVRVHHPTLPSLASSPCAVHEYWTPPHGQWHWCNRRGSPVRLVRRSIWSDLDSKFGAVFATRTKICIPRRPQAANSGRL